MQSYTNNDEEETNFSWKNYKNGGSQARRPQHRTDSEESPIHEAFSHVNKQHHTQTSFGEPSFSGDHPPSTWVFESKASEQQNQSSEPAAEFDRADRHLPNEINIGARSNFSYQVRQILGLLARGYINCKLVARGMACERACEILEFIKNKAPHYHFDCSETKALNKWGMIVNELHIIISH